jgi:thiamine-phosphate diphosphorylase
VIPKVFVVTDRKLAGDLVGAVGDVVNHLPCRAAVLLREKDLPVRELVALARRLRTKDGLNDGDSLIVSGRLDVALAAGADGVHLGGEAPDFESIRRLAPAGFLVGVSIHGDELPPPEASYALLAPVFPTSSKPGAITLGLDGLRRTVSRTQVPIIALGGIDERNAPSCLEAGAHGIALRSAFMNGAGKFANNELSPRIRRYV